LTREWIFFTLFPEKKKITSSLNTTMSKLLSFAEELLIREKLNDRFLYKKHLLLERFLEKGLHKQFLSQYKKTMLRFSNIKRRDSANHIEQFLIARNYYLFNKTISGRNQAITPSMISNHLDSYYLIQKLSLECEKEIQLDISAENDGSLEELIEFTLVEHKEKLEVNTNFPQSNRSLLLKKMLVCIQNPQDEEAFEEYMTLFLNTNPTQVDSREYNEIFIHGINYCIDKIIEGKSAYRKKLFELYKLTVEFGLIYENGFLNLNRVKNIIGCAAQVGELEWASYFLEDYKSEIHPDQYNNAYHFYKATIYFYSGEYDEAITYLNKIETDIDKYYYLNRTTLLLRCYYEGKESIAFYNTCKTFRANIRRNKKLTIKEQRIYGTFVRFVYFVYQYKEGFSKKTKPQLVEMITTAKYISHKQWLLQKIEELR